MKVLRYSCLICGELQMVPLPDPGKSYAEQRRCQHCHKDHDIELDTFAGGVSMMLTINTELDERVAA